MSPHLPDDPLCRALVELIQRLEADPYICVFRIPQFPGGFNIETINTLAAEACLVTPPATIFEVIDDPVQRQQTLRLHQPGNWPPIDLVLLDQNRVPDRAWKTKAEKSMKAGLEKWLAARLTQLAPTTALPVETTSEVDPPVEKQPRKKARHKRGRPKETDEATDAKIVAAWESGEYKTYADLAHVLKILNRNNLPDAIQVEQALDRHRKRHPPTEASE